LALVLALLAMGLAGLGIFLHSRRESLQGWGGALVVAGLLLSMLATAAASDADYQSLGRDRFGRWGFRLCMLLWGGLLATLFIVATV
jgi:hypothetical protein